MVFSTDKTDVQVHQIINYASYIALQKKYALMLFLGFKTDIKGRRKLMMCLHIFSKRLIVIAKIISRYNLEKFLYDRILFIHKKCLCA